MGEFFPSLSGHKTDFFFWGGGGLLGVRCRLCLTVVYFCARWMNFAKQQQKSIMIEWWYISPLLRLNPLLLCRLPIPCEVSGIRFMTCNLKELTAQFVWTLSCLGAQEQYSIVVLESTTPCAYTKPSVLYICTSVLTRHLKENILLVISLVSFRLYVPTIGFSSWLSGIKDDSTKYIFNVVIVVAIICRAQDKKRTKRIF